MTSLLRGWIIYKIIWCTLSHGLIEKVVSEEGVSRLSYESEKRMFQGKINPSYRVIQSRLSISRKKRSLGSTDTTEVSLQLPGIENEDSISLQLQQVDITHPDMIIRVNGQIQKSIIQRDCYFCGCENGTCATVSTCGGVTGIIENSSGSYQLEEVSESDIEALPGNKLDNLSGNASSNSRKRRDASEKTLVMWKLDINLNEGNKYIPLPEAPPSSYSSDLDEDNLYGSKLNHQEFEIVDEDVQHSPRVRRRVNGPYTVELAVFSDHHHSRYIAQRYPGENIVEKTQDLVLTLMNAVHRMYDTATLGDSRLGIMVKEIDIETEDVEKHEDHDGDIYEYLSSFCFWQAAKNPRGMPGEWDHALLLSGLDLWNHQKTQNSTVGLAWVGGMCSNSYSCTINEGTSLGAAYIIAHEMGHNLGMRHDGDPGAANCPKNKYLMAPVMSSGAATWSECSKLALDKFLTKKGSCLKSSRGRTGKSEDHHGDSPGERYNADQQCHYMYGNGWTHFNNNQDPFNNVCKEIWCRMGRNLRTPTAPALEGTSCGNKKVCHLGRCKKIKKIEKKAKKKNRGGIKTNKRVKKKNNKNNKKGRNLGIKRPFKDNIDKKPKKGTINNLAKNVLKTNNEVSTIIKTKTKTTGNKNKVKKNKKKIRRIENANFITIKQRLKYIKGKGWKVKIIKIKKTQKMRREWRKKMKEKRENETDEERRIRLEKKKKKKERKKKRKEKNRKLKLERQERQKERNKKRKEEAARKSKVNKNNKIQKAKSEKLDTKNKSDKYVINVPLKNKAEDKRKTCEPEKIKHVPGKGWLVKVNLKCFKKLKSHTVDNVESDLKKKLRRILKKGGHII